MEHIQYKGGNMYLGLQGDYIVSVTDDRKELENIQVIAGITSIIETSEPVKYIDGKYIVGLNNIKDALRIMREKAYIVEVDKITAHIQRLRDAEQTEEVEAQIAELISERDAKVEEIKERYSYSEGEEG